MHINWKAQSDIQAITMWTDHASWNLGALAAHSKASLWVTDLICYLNPEPFPCLPRSYLVWKMAKENWNIEERTRGTNKRGVLLTWKPRLRSLHYIFNKNLYTYPCTLPLSLVCEMVTQANCVMEKLGNKSPNKLKYRVALRVCNLGLFQSLHPLEKETQESPTPPLPVIWLLKYLSEGFPSPHLPCELFSPCCLHLLPGYLFNWHLCPDLPLSTPPSIRLNPPLLALTLALLRSTYRGPNCGFITELV